MASSSPRLKNTHVIPAVSGQDPIITVPEAKARVFILYTGGTIGMAQLDPSVPGSPLVPKSLEELKEYVPGLKKEGLDLQYGTLDEPLDSSNLGPGHWIEMARRIETVYDDFDGFVILHGTDTLAFTASALSFMFENLAKPVVITGSQLPISDVRTDAVLNFVNAVEIAGYRAFNLPCVPEVVVVFADKIVRGCRVRKVSASAWAAFDSSNYPVLGSIGEHIRIDSALLRPMPRADQRFQVTTDLNTRVMDIGLTPALQGSHLRNLLLGEHSDIDAIVLRTYGAGNAPNHSEFLEVIAEVNRANKTVVNVTQHQEGTVEMGLYAASSGLLERGVISALDMTPEAALTKLMWTLGTKLPDQVAVQMQVNQRGEQSRNLFDLRYGSFGTKASPENKFMNYVVPDRRFSVHHLDRSVIRLAGLGFTGIQRGETIRLRVFMNMRSASPKTARNHNRCVAEVPITWLGEPLHIAAVLDDAKTRSVIGEGEIILTVLAVDPAVKMWCEGLYLALFARVS